MEEPLARESATGTVSDIARRKEVHFVLNLPDGSTVRFYTDRWPGDGETVTVEWEPDGSTRPQRALSVHPQDWPVS
jgi:hypothetical protein